MMLLRLAYRFDCTLYSKGAFRMLAIQVRQMQRAPAIFFSVDNIFDEMLLPAEQQMSPRGAKA